MRKFLESKVARLAVAGVIAAGAVVGVSVAASGATSASDCKTLSYPLCARSVAAPQVVDNSLPASKILPADRAKFLADTDVFGKGMKFVCPAKVIEHIGGPFATNKTKVCSFDIPAGVWMVNSSAFFARTAPGVAGTRPQLALRWDNGSQWGADIGTIMGAEISPTKDRELTGSTVKVLHLQTPITVDVYGFGYNDNGSAAGSGDITVAVHVAAVRIG